MHWNHRILVKSTLNEKNELDPWLEIVEVYYRDDGELLGFADICKGSETLAGLKAHFTRIMEAFDQPMLTLNDFEKDKEEDEHSDY
jgi:hypothetical protein